MGRDRALKSMLHILLESICSSWSLVCYKCRYVKSVTSYYFGSFIVREPKQVTQVIMLIAFCSPKRDPMNRKRKMTVYFKRRAVFYNENKVFRKRR